jgi:hypothetical protein
MIYRTLANLAVAHQKWRSFWVGSAALTAASFVASAVGALGRPLCTGCLRSRHQFFPSLADSSRDPFAFCGEVIE